MDGVLVVCLGVGVLLAYVYGALALSEHQWSGSEGIEGAEMYTVKEGDLLFYHSSGALHERLIVAATSNGDPHADFVHVAIVNTLTDGARDGTIIEAQWRGIVKSPLPSLTSNRIVIYPLTPASTKAQIVALNSARSKVGWRYGIADIVCQVLRLLRLPFRVARLRSLDCSHLAAEYAAWATLDATLYGMVCDDGADISPNDLGRYYGLVSPAPVQEPETQEAGLP